MKIGMIVKEAGYCTGEIKITRNITFEEFFNFMSYVSVCDFWIREYDFVKTTATIKISDIVAIWERK